MFPRDQSIIQCLKLHEYVQSIRVIILKWQKKNKVIVAATTTYNLNRLNFVLFLVQALLISTACHTFGLVACPLSFPLVLES